jgi:hypothetical protein
VTAPEKVGRDDQHVEYIANRRPGGLPHGAVTIPALMTRHRRGGAFHVKRHAAATTIALFAVACCAESARAARSIAGAGPADFAGAAVERFRGPSVTTGSYTFGGGMSYRNLKFQGDYINYVDRYGLGGAEDVSGGREGPGDGYFATYSMTSFQLAFAGGVRSFGFYGAESVMAGADAPYASNDGLITLEFYGTDNVPLGTATADSRGATSATAFDTFFGFVSTSDPIGRVVFKDVGWMVMDDVTFTAAAAVPSPGLATPAVAFLVALRRPRRR